MRSAPASATAFAPATVANLAVGFDLLGHPIEGVGDEVSVTRVEGSREVVLEGVSGPGAEKIPREAARNTATVALRALIDQNKLGCGFRVSVKKGIPLSSGMGGSAASAAGAVVAAAAVAGARIAPEALVAAAMAGEAAASGSAHADNVAPCILGGVVLAVPGETPELVRLPVPPEILCVVVHPHVELETSVARAVLRREIALEAHVRQSARLGAFVSACHSGDVGLLRRVMEDLIVEPQRAPLVPEFAALKRAARAAGVVSFSISGAGPSVFAWAQGPVEAERAKHALLAVLRKAGIPADSWVGPAGAPGARVLPAGR